MPLVVYADVFIIVNLYIDFFLLWCVRAFLHLEAKGGRLVLGGLFGALCGLISLVPLPAWAALPAGGAGALVAVWGAFWPLPWRRLARAWLCMWLCSFLLAGFFLFLIRFLAPRNMAVLGSALYLDISLPLLFFFTCLAYGLFWAIQRLFPRDASALRLCTLQVCHQGAAVELAAKADTGNALREPFSGLPVIICEEKALKAAVPQPVRDFLTSPCPEAAAHHMRLVPFSSVGGSGLLPAFRPDCVSIKGTGQKLPCYLAVCRSPLSAGQFSALFNPDLFPE